MQSDQAPCSTTRRVEFPPSVTSCLRDQREEAAALLGGILSGTYVCPSVHVEVSPSQLS